MLYLFESHISGLRADDIMGKIGFSNSCRVEATSFAGGIWVLWKDTVNADILALHSQAIHMRISNYSSMSKFFCSAFYASPQHGKRKGLWEFLGALATQTSKPWVAA